MIAVWAKRIASEWRLILMMAYMPMLLTFTAVAMIRWPKNTTGTPAILTGNMDSETQDGVDNIGYVLPDTWEGVINGSGLLLTPTNSGGYLLIQMYPYPGDYDVREYYCQVRDNCYEGNTYFIETRIGNIDGYKAGAIDTGDGTTQYLGAKDDRMYVVSSYDPPGVNTYETEYKKVMETLIF